MVVVERALILESLINPSALSFHYLGASMTGSWMNEVGTSSRSGWELRDETLESPERKLTREENGDPTSSSIQDPVTYMTTSSSKNLSLGFTYSKVHLPISQFYYSSSFSSMCHISYKRTPGDLSKSQCGICPYLPKTGLVKGHS